MHEQGDQLLNQVLTASDDAAVQQLLTAFWHGYPVEKLRVLLHSPDEHAVKAGSWIASELATASAPLLADIAPLLNHPLRYVRYFALDTVLLNATPGHGAILARAIALIEDPDDAVRSKALALLARATDEQLRASVPYLAPPLLTLVRWLTHKPVTATETQEVQTRLNDRNPLIQLFAVAKAARCGQEHPHLLEQAAQHSDAEMRAFAQAERDGIARQQRRQQRRRNQRSELQ